MRELTLTCDGCGEMLSFDLREVEGTELKEGWVELSVHRHQGAHGHDLRHSEDAHLCPGCREELDESYGSLAALLGENLAQ